MLEKELKIPVVEWLKKQGYEVTQESGIFSNCDLIGFKFQQQNGRNVPELEYVIAIELKLKDIKGVLNQCRLHRHRANEVYAAMPVEVVQKFRFDTIQKFWDMGIGLLTVDVNNQDVQIRHSSLKYLVDLQNKKRVLWRWHKFNNRNSVTSVSSVAKKDLRSEI